LPQPLIILPLDESVERREAANIVRQSNTLIQNTRFNLTTTENKLWLYIIKHIKPTDTSLGELEFTIRDFCKAVGISPNSGSSYMNVRAALKSLADKSVYIDLDGSGDETLVRWLDEVKLSKKAGLAKITITGKLKPYLLELHERYTQFSWLYTVNMRSKYSVRIYELLKSYENMNTPIMMSLDELRRMLYLTDTYDWTDIKRNVIDIARKEINECSDITFKYSPRKTGRTVTDIIFEITPVPLVERDRRIKEVEQKMGPDMFSDYSIPSDDADFDEVYHSGQNVIDGTAQETENTDEPKNEKARIFTDYDTKTKRSMEEAIKAHMDYGTLVASNSPRQNNGLDFLIRTLASLSCRKVKDSKIEDGVAGKPNPRFIKQLNGIIENHGSLTSFAAALSDKYIDMFDGKNVKNIMAYSTRCMENDLDCAEQIISQYNSSKEKNYGKGQNILVTRETQSVKSHMLGLGRPHSLKRRDF
jgi:plasmid replication initiation protein